MRKQETHAFSDTVLEISKNLLQKRKAHSQGGLLTGSNPSAFDSSNPLRLWIIQLGIIVMMTQLLAIPLRKIRQPKVIAEVLGGILLGPTVFGRIPGLTDRLFPAESRPYLTLVADIGLCLYLFLVGLEIEGELVKRNAKLSAFVAVTGILVPFGLGALLSIPLYDRFIDRSVHFSHFMLFVGVAYSITALPILCRILTELKMLDTTVGIVVVSAGIANDLLGWVLLALCVALVSAESPLNALWMLLLCLAWTLLLLFPVRACMVWLARKTGSTKNGPSILYMSATILLMFASCLLTDIIGVNAFFGAFMVGLIVPREGGLAISLTEKLEDIVTIMFLPLYFALSGLSTNLSLLNTGVIWGFTIAICASAFLGKFGACSLAARATGFSWRQSTTVGALMSCKGLIELIVLNIGLSAGILNERVFSMFVLQALLLTFLTTPLASVLYPPRFRVRAADASQNLFNVQGDEEGQKTKNNEVKWRTRFTVVLDKIEHLPGMMSLTQLLQPPFSPYDPAQPEKSQTTDSTTTHAAPPELIIDALRLMELSDRTSGVMKGQAANTLIQSDPILEVFRTFGELNGISVGPSLSIAASDDLASCVADHAKITKSQLILVPWLLPFRSDGCVGGSGGDTRAAAVTATRQATTSMTNPFDLLFKTGGSESTSQFVRGVFAHSSSVDVALYVDRSENGLGESRAASGTTQHLYLPFIGGPDDRLALELVVQLCLNPRVHATIVRVTKRETSVEDSAIAGGDDDDLRSSATKTYVGDDETWNIHTGLRNTHLNTQTKLQSEVADTLLWECYTSTKLDTCVNDSNLLHSALSRIEFLQITGSGEPLHAIIKQVSDLHERAITSGSRFLIVVGRSKRFVVGNHRAELKELVEEHGGINGETNMTIGDVASALVVSGAKARLVVLQAGKPDDLD